MYVQSRSAVDNSNHSHWGRANGQALGFLNGIQCPVPKPCGCTLCTRWDASLIEWDPSDYRIFVGDMGSEVNDEILSKAFSHYSSFVKGKMVRNKQTNKNKGASYQHPFHRVVC